MKKKPLSPLVTGYILGLIFLFSCTTNPSFKTDDLHGTWKSVEAFRGGKKTESLANTYFTFNGNGTMETNLTMSGDTLTGKYLIEGSKINESGANDLSYNIETLNPEDLTISFELSGIDFKILLNKEETATN